MMTTNNKVFYFSCFIIFQALFSSNLWPTACVIRPAASHELDAILALDRAVTFEFFKPLYLKSYRHLIDPNKVDYFLNVELDRDKQLFQDVINHQGDERLYVAWDPVQERIAGLVSFHREGDTVILDLLLVDKGYRNRGIGRALVTGAQEAFPDIKSIIVTPLAIDNEPTLRFYESLGFKNTGPIVSDEKTIYGVARSAMYFYYVWTIQRP
jgi:GNAT superfamily N-acetyltransferase